ncbi:MYND-type domain-containing protein [Mycena kentingensis (nom. inval.)]|nr:MYND-type domain-containing protein [Mycena kentingensis (nom. inval.)]
MLHSLSSKCVLSIRQSEQRTSTSAINATSVMHPSLKVANLSRLPASVRSMATAVCSGELEHIRPLAVRMQTMLNKHAQKLLSPVFYSILDQEHISKIEDFDAVPPERVALRVEAVYIAMSCLTDLATKRLIEAGAIRDLWPRIFAWMAFLRMFEENLPVFRSQAVVYVELLYALWHHYPAQAEVEIGANPALLYFYGRAWRELLPERSECPKVMRMLAVLIGGLPGQEDGLDEQQVNLLCSGVGGDYGGLSALLVAHLQAVFPSGDVPAPPRAIREVSSIMYLLANVGQADTLLHQYFLDAGLTGALTTACRAFLLTPTHPDDPDMFDVFLTAATLPLSLRCAHLWAAESLEAGLLPLVFACGNRRDVEDTLQSLLAEELPPLTVYLSVLRPIRDTLPLVRDLDVAKHLRPRLRKPWADFLALVEERLRIVEMYESGELTRLRVCDSSLCRKVVPKRELKRCGRCRTRYFCSRDCQKHEYYKREWGHRDECEGLQETYNSRSQRYSCELNHKDNAFIRALLNYDYSRRKEEIAVLTLHCLHANRGPDDFPAVRFDYTQGQCRVSVVPLPPDAKLRDLLAAEGADDAYRLHVFAISKPPETYSTALPMRAENGAFLKGLREIVAGIAPPLDGEEAKRLDVSPYLERIRTLVEVDVLETH